MPTSPRRPTPREKSAARTKALLAQREAAARRARLWRRVGIPIAVVLIVIAGLVIAKVANHGPKSGPAAQPAATGVISGVTGVPPTVFDSVGAGTIATPPTAITAPALTEGGKPRVLYIGAEYCPYCAAERWAVVAALARFGTFSNLGQTTSSAQDVYPSTATLSFHGATYTSSKLAFTGVETTSNQVVNGGYATLDTPTAADEKVLTTYDAAPYTKSPGSIPFVDIGGRYLIVGASYDPAVLQRLTHAQIAAALADPTSAVAKAVVGTANVITAAVCTLTGQAPATVCSSSGVTAAKQKLGG